ncbi:DNA-binding protein [Olivibacter sp. SDN3]|uniref:HTH domain-containing protein n=1 Tax=Olivibacter sp. SDN3 TaxID=2764720 RepID=UPI00165118C8|nr:HTH domain-containing protein [Olivibacter sp. SDN3]QNL48166.1 DNA-binding protein [Olivibacter sp. SDN3]
MKLLVYIERINLLHKLIRQRRTGSPMELSKRLGLSTSRMYRVIEELRLNGAPIAYSRQQQTYYYEYNYHIVISATFTSLEQHEMRDVSGGEHVGTVRLFPHQLKKSDSVPFILNA